MQAAATAANFAAAAAAVAGPSDDLLLDLLRRRYEARLQRDFPTSDVLREQLRGLGIYTDDRTKTWRSNSGRVGSLEGPDFLSPPGYGGSITPLHEGRSLTTEQIHDKLSQREQARMSKDFATADEIRRELNACGVSVDDNAKTWACNDGRSGPRPDAHGNLPPAAIAGVQAYTASYAQVVTLHRVMVGFTDRGQDTVRTRGWRALGYRDKLRAKQWTVE